MMNESVPSSTKPDFLSVEDLIAGIQSGEIRIPRFQRPYVWGPEDMVQLLDSMMRGYPIGTLLVWQTERTDITSIDSIGPVIVPPYGPTSKSYIVDGHQRVATIVGVFNLPEEFPRNRQEEWKWWIGYDLRERMFIHLRPAIDPIPLHIFPLRELLRTVSFARRTRNILGSVEYSESEAEALIDQADVLARAIRSFRIPFTLMKSGSLDHAVTIFSRVNQRGRDMTADQMVSALTFKDRNEGDFDLAESIDDILNDLAVYSFGDIERKIVLQFILLATGLDFTRTSYEQIVDRTTHERMRPAVERAKYALVEAAEFLVSEVGVKTSRLLPYASIFFILAIFFDVKRTARRSVSIDQKYQLKRWFWAVSFNGWFAGANTTDMRKAAAAMREYAVESPSEYAGDDLDALFLDSPLRPLPESYDRRSARVRASLLVQIIAGSPRDPSSGEPLDGASIFSDAIARDIPYFFPSVKKPLVSSLANRVILPKTYPRNARMVFSSLFDDDRDVLILRSHFLDDNCRVALTGGDAEWFMHMREKNITNAESKFLRQFDLVIEDHLGRDYEDYDVDE